eukprot:CAMPEP_0113903912 /NCGR_PEP_ID=MMETSP0780_2-20120614/22880_1 /TAXON_ID=652834 /ORGANISM="Palpitomonas bilix" /LENGTH=514 /DNA_ID=CAMNT_0000897303 /DNA_START=317 /DNA_END=1864 /DNA_ORIENTATION=- /assembly_acc=CAM_ASM_000599
MPPISSPRGSRTPLRAGIGRSNVTASISVHSRTVGCGAMEAGASAGLDARRSRPASPLRTYGADSTLRRPTGRQALLDRADPLDSLPASMRAALDKPSGALSRARLEGRRSTFDEHYAVEARVVERSRDYQRSTLHDNRSVRPASARRIFITGKEETEEMMKGVSSDVGGRRIVGLRNLGNTCYLNACLQCLVNQQPLARFFLKGWHNEAMTRMKRKAPVAKAFGEFTKEMWGGGGSVIDPSHLKDRFGRAVRKFSNFDQQDTQECLRFFLDTLHEQLKEEPEKHSKEEWASSDEDEIDEDKAIRYWKRYRRRNNSFVTDVFCGQLKSTVTCLECGRRSVCFDPFWDLSLPIPSRGKECTIEDCLNLFCKVETSDGSDYRCKECRKMVRYTKKLEIYKFPHVLVLHLKRFSQSGSGSSGFFSRFRSGPSKINSLVRFDTRESVDLAPFSDRKSRPPSYRLNAVANHMGSTYGGHYTAYCKVGKSWHLFDDSRASSVDERVVCSSSAYVLFYSSL